MHISVFCASATSVERNMDNQLQALLTDVVFAHSCCSVKFCILQWYNCVGDKLLFNLRQFPCLHAWLGTLARAFPVHASGHVICAFRLVRVDGV